MLKYVDTAVTFSEVPDEISLCINFSNCPCHCDGCHSSYLAQDIGNVLTSDALRSLLQANKGVSCVTFMGGDSDPLYINTIAKYVKNTYKLKVAWYSGRDTISPDINIGNFNYIKIGHYDKIAGALNSPTTNQRFYKTMFDDNKYILIDETYRFIKQIVK